MTLQSPECHFFACGAAEGATRMSSLDGARLNASLGAVNPLGSCTVIPPGSHLVEPVELPPGTLVPMAVASLTSELPGEVISAGVAIGYPTAATEAAVVCRYAACGHKEDVEGIVRRLAEEGLAMRGLSVATIRSVAVQHKVAQIASVVAAVVLCDRP